LFLWDSNVDIHSNAAPDFAMHIVAADYDGIGTFNVYQDSAIPVATRSATLTPIGNFTVGADDVGAPYLTALTGIIGDVLCYAGTPTDLPGLFTALVKRWGVIPSQRVQGFDLLWRPHVQPQRDL
jgi:hypothetical protein